MMINKRALSRRGHFIFSGMLVLFTFYFLSHYIALSLSTFVWYIPVFIIGIVFPDVIESPGIGKVNHRRFFHSRRMLLFIIVVFLPLSLWWGTEYNSFWFFASSFFFGYLSHLLGDALTSKLPR